jgi:hypothetical protein
MKKIITSILVLTAWTASLSAQTTMREQADAIVREYVQNEITLPYFLYASEQTPAESGFTVTTSAGERFTAKYACWAYFLNENPSATGPSSFRYLFVKENNANLLEITSSNDLGPSDLSGWRAIAIPAGLNKVKESNTLSFYPNPVGDVLHIPCTGNPDHIEIYDLKGTRLFSGTLSGKETCGVNVAFLNAGVYGVSVYDENGKVDNYKIIKN